MTADEKSAAVFNGLIILLLLLAGAFLANLWGHPTQLPPPPPVDPAFTNTTTARHSLSDLIRLDEDTSVYDCYLCHEEDVEMELEFDQNHQVILPEEHEDLVMLHGSHNRNNNCFNCHNQTDLRLLQTRDANKLTLEQSSQLCASCHGPTYRDWEAGVHGRINGYWNTELGPADRIGCASCHNPHRPTFPSFKPAPGPRRPSGQKIAQPTRGR